MATNRKQADGTRIDATASECTGPNDPIESGDPVVWGNVPGVALADERTDDDKVLIQTDGVFELSVTGANNAGSSAISPGDIVYIDGTELNADDIDGTRFGYALADVGSGATTAIDVKVGY